MKIPLALAAFSLMTQSACSNSLSDSEVKKAVIGGLGITNCRNFSIHSFEKINGVAGSDGKHYQVAVKYLLKVSPLPDAKRIQDELAAKHANEDSLLQQAQQKYREFQAALEDQPQEDVSKNAILNVRLDHEVSMAEAAIRDRETNDGAILLKRYSAGCASESNFMWGFISALYASDKNLITTGVTKEITDIVDLIKTDNGWMQLK